MKEKTIELFGRPVVVNEKNIIDLFQQVGQKYFHQTKDAGCGARNVTGNFNPMYDLTTIQCYPYNEYHNVWILFGGHDYELSEFNFDGQVNYLLDYYKFLKDAHDKDEVKNIVVDDFIGGENGDYDKKAYRNAFHRFCEEKGAEMVRDEMFSDHKNDMKDIMYCTNKGELYWYADENSSKPTMKLFTYPKPSELDNNGIIRYLIDECLNAGMTAEIRELADFLDLPKKVKDEQGLPKAYFYLWIWEDGKFDDFYKQEDLNIVPKESEDIEYLKDIWSYIKDGKFVDDGGELHGDLVLKECQSMDDFIKGFKSSGLSLQDFLAQYDDVSRYDSLWCKCQDSANYLIDRYIGDGVEEEKKIELATLMHSFILSQKGSSYFPKK